MFAELMLGGVISQLRGSSGFDVEGQKLLKLKCPSS